MKTTKSLSDVFFKHQLKLEVFTLFLFIFAMSTNLDNIRMDDPWHEESFIVMLVVAAALFTTALWMRYEQLIAKKIVNHIKRNDIPKGPDRDAMVAKLSTRQREILEMILLKVPNQEIMEELSMEQSSLSAHIRRIYKVLIRSQVRAKNNA
jgi:DNA-binding CsgD family transcriptional regulator